MSPTLLTQRVLHRASRRASQSRYHVAVDVECNGHTRVPERLGDDLRVYAIRQEQRGAGVPEVVEA